MKCLLINFIVSLIVVNSNTSNPLFLPQLPVVSTKYLPLHNIINIYSNHHIVTKELLSKSNTLEDTYCLKLLHIYFLTIVYKNVCTVKNLKNTRFTIIFDCWNLWQVYMFVFFTINSYIGIPTFFKETVSKECKWLCIK